MPSILSYQSSEVDWCESNFQHSPIIAEFYNTISNVTFFIFGPLMMVLMHPYAQKRSRLVYVNCFLFMVIGLFSIYFHMTLSFLGQMLDELSILWFMASCYSAWMPRSYFPACFKENRAQFSSLVIFITIISTFLSFVKPTVNAYVLNIMGLHVFYLVVKEYKKTSNKELQHIIKVIVGFWLCAVTSWISDRALCSFWQSVHFSYLHSIWHILISFTFPYAMTIMTLLDTKYEMPGEPVRVRYWPRDSWPMGLPYTELGGAAKSC